MKILLIEDDRELADSMRFQLEKEGYETDICDDGEEGLYYMKERSHDLVILDRDPLAVPQEELRDIRVLETWKDGVPIFCRDCTGRITG